MGPISKHKARREFSKNRGINSANVPEEMPGVAWEPKGGEFVVTSLMPDYVDDIEEPPETPKQRKRRIVSEAIAGDMLDKVMALGDGQLESAGAVIDQFLAGDVVGEYEESSSRIQRELKGKV